MSDDREPTWAPTLRELQALAQTGLTYAKDAYDIARYRRLHEIAVAMTAEGFSLDPVLVGELFTRQSGYATPQVDVRAAVFRDHRVLLVCEDSDGCWTLPGGWADVNLSPAENAVKETAEEACVEIAVRKLAGVYDRRIHPYRPSLPGHVYKLYFVCDLVAGEPGPGDETTAADFFPLDDLPKLSLARTIEPHLRAAYAHHLDPDLPTEFD